MYAVCSVRNAGRLARVKWVNLDKINYTGFARSLTYVCYCNPLHPIHPSYSTALKRQFNKSILLVCTQEQSLTKQHKYSYSSAHHGHDKIKHKSKVTEIVPDKQESDAPQTEEPKSVGLMQRFKNAYKQYGKTLVAVHVATSIVWFSSFYYAAASGLDVVPLLEKMGASETILKPFRSSGIGNIAVAYLLYKLATPARYTVTIVGTQQAAKYLKTTGYIQPIPKGDTIQELVKEGSKHVQHTVKKRSEKVRHDVRTRTRENREKLRESFKKTSSEFMSQKSKNGTKE